MPKLQRFTAKKILLILQKTGFYVHHQKGSHINLRHRIKTYLRVVIPFHNRVLAPKTIKSIIVQAELDINTVKEFMGM